MRSEVFASSFETRSSVPFRQSHPSYGVSNHRVLDEVTSQSSMTSHKSGKPHHFYLDDSVESSEDEIWDIKTSQKFA